MKLLLLLSIIGLAMSQAAVIQKPLEAFDESRIQGIVQEPQLADEVADDKKVDKRSYGWSPWIWPSYGHGHGIGHGIGHSLGHIGHISIGWPIYSHGWSGHGWSGHGLHGWSSGWPLSHGHGWQGSHGWHSKW